MNSKHKKLLLKLFIPILSIIVIWYIFVGILFSVNPNLFCRTRVNENITWEIETHAEDPGGTWIYFNITYEVWINNPLPFMHNFDGCHLNPAVEATLTNTSISDEVLRYGPMCFLALVPAKYTPGIKYGSAELHIRVNYPELSELPEGLYTFWIGFGDLYGRESILDSHKTYMNVSEDGISVYSDDSSDFKVWYWEGLIISISILFGSIFFSYLVLEYILVFIGKKKSRAIEE